MSRRSGLVTSWERGRGKILDRQTQQSINVFFKDIVSGGIFKMLNIGEEVEYSLVQTQWGPAAKEVVVKKPATHRMFDLQGHEITNAELQNKGLWCTHGERKELVFLGYYGEKLGLELNQEKENNPYALDLRNKQNGYLGDLKTQNTPFFTVTRRYPDYEPQHTVTFNVKDYKRYKDKDVKEIYFWVDWVAVKFHHRDGTVIPVQPMTGVWRIEFSKLDEMVQSIVPHAYLNRKEDTLGNAKDSYPLDLRDGRFEKLI